MSNLAVNPPVGVGPVRAMDSVQAKLRASVMADAIELVRDYIGDQPEHNELRDKKTELEDYEIALSILAAADFFNSVPPPTPMAAPGRGIPLHMFLALSSFTALEMMIMRRKRNEVASVDNNVAVDVTKSKDWDQFLRNQRAEYRKMVQDYKYMYNRRGSATILPSVYLYNFLATV